MGGLITVTNGPFNVTNGDLLTYIFGFEEEYYEQDETSVPKRLEIPGDPANYHLEIQTPKPNAPPLKRQKLNFSMSFKGLRDADKADLPYIIPFVPTDDALTQWVDGGRCFARALSNARPHEALDIMIGVQSM